MFPLDEVRAGDVLLVRPGEKVPADGRGAGRPECGGPLAADRESIPVEVGPGDGVTGATVNQTGSFRMTWGTGADSALMQIVSMVERAQMSKAAVARFAGPRRRRIRSRR
jgi:Cu+-exporting ATPase